MFIQFFCRMSLIIQARTQKSPLIRHYFAFIETIPTLMIWCDYSKRTNVTGNNHLNYLAIFMKVYAIVCIYVWLLWLVHAESEECMREKEKETRFLADYYLKHVQCDFKCYRFEKKSFSYWFACTMNSVYKLTMPIQIDLFYSRPIKATDSSIYSVYTLYIDLRHQEHKQLAFFKRQRTYTHVYARMQTAPSTSYHFL